MPDELASSAPSEVRLACFEAAGSTLVYHATHSVADLDAPDATGGTRRFECLCVVRRCGQHSDGHFAEPRVVALPESEAHGPFLPSSWSLRYIPALDLLLWNVGDTIHRINLVDAEGGGGDGAKWRQHSMTAGFTLAPTA